MIIRSKAPLRLGLAGGGTDVSPYSDTYGGFVLNASINLYAYCTIRERNDGRIIINAPDMSRSIELSSSLELPINGELDLHKGVGEYEMAKLSYEIERKDIGLSGGKQDQYAATFGGFNFMEFFRDERVIVNPLRVKRWIIDELEASMLLYYTGASRASAQIIDEQKRNTREGNKDAIEAMHEIKQSAVDMKEAVLKGDIRSYARILGRAWENKKKMAGAISNKHI
jgi:D-glycero-alpha-D-manno-heptose-7-phosphate kinase